MTSRLGAFSDARGGVMSELLLDAAGRRRSPATLPEFHAGRPPRNKLGRFADVKLRFKVSDAAPGTVIGQEPATGLPLIYRSPLTPTVATTPGPVRYKLKKVPYVPSDSELAELRAQLEQAKAQGARIVVPDLSGLPVADAQRVLRSLGLRGQVTGAGETVTGQARVAGQSLASGDAVTLTAR